jgi:ribosome-associated translation inhibitor RaiA
MWPEANNEREKCDMSLSEQLDKASAQLKRLSERASAAEANAQALKAKNKAALEQQVNAAQADAKQASDNLKASVKETQDESTQWWGQVQDDWKSFIAKVRKNADQAKAHMKADQAEIRAELAEDNAAAAVDFAYAALEEAEYQVLNAARARIDAEEAKA